MTVIKNTVRKLLLELSLKTEAGRSLYFVIAHLRPNRSFAYNMLLKEEPQIVI